MRTPRTLLVLALAASPLATGHAAAQAETPVVTGWWTRQPGAQAPDGGFQVGNAPDGPLSLAALRLPPRTVRLTLPVAADTLGALGTLQLCLATSRWSVASGGPLSAAPTYDCGPGRHVLPRRQGETWVADLGVLQRSATRGYGIVVAPHAEAVPLPYTFTVASPRVVLAPAPVTALPSGAGPRPQPSPRPPAPWRAATLPPAPTAAVDAPAVEALPPTGATATPAQVAVASVEDAVTLARRLVLVLVALTAGATAGACRAFGSRSRVHPRGRSGPPPSAALQGGA